MAFRVGEKRPVVDYDDVKSGVLCQGTDLRADVTTAENVEHRGWHEGFQVHLGPVESFYPECLATGGVESKRFFRQVENPRSFALENFPGPSLDTLFEDGCVEPPQTDSIGEQEELVEFSIRQLLRSEHGRHHTLTAPGFCVDHSGKQVRFCIRLDRFGVDAHGASAVEPALTGLFLGHCVARRMRTSGGQNLPADGENLRFETAPSYGSRDAAVVPDQHLGALTHGNRTAALHQ